MDKLIITAAICGAEVTKEQNPNVPYTVEEIVREAKSAVDAGAAIVHLHVREDDGTPTQSHVRFQECTEAILKACPNVILIPSTGGAVGMTPDERLDSTNTTPVPEMATLDCGTCNFGDDIFDNTMPTMRAFGKRMIEKGIKPEYECFEMGHLDTILTMARKGEVPGNPMQFNFVLGRRPRLHPRHCRQPLLARQQDSRRQHLDRHRHRPSRLHPRRSRHRHGRQCPRGL